MKGTKARRFAVCLTVLLVLLPMVTAMLPVTVTSAPAKGNGGAVPSEYLGSGVTVCTAEAWEAQSDSNSSVITEAGETAFRVTARNINAGAVVTFPDGLATEGRREVGLVLSSTSNAVCTVSLRVFFGDTSAIVTTRLPYKESYYMYVRLPEGTESISRISVSASFKDKKGESGGSDSLVIYRALLSDTDHGETAERYSAFTVDGLSEDMSVTSAAAVCGRGLTADGEEKFALRVTLEGDGGGITAMFAPDGKNYGVCGSSAVTEGRREYLFYAENAAPSSAYRLEFTGIESHPVYVYGVDIIELESGEVTSVLGEISRCTFTEDVLSVAGSITRDAAVKYIDGELCLFEVPMWGSLKGAMEEEPLAVMKMTTSFSFSASVTSDGVAVNSYTVAIRDGDKLYPITEPVFASGGISHNEPTKSAVGSVFGISPEEAFSAGFDNYVIDVAAASLLSDKSGESGTVFTHYGVSYYPDRAETALLDTRIRFLSACGIGVTFRMTDLGDGDFSPSSETDCRRLAAAVAYLSERYAPYGFIVSHADSNKVSKTAHEFAEVIRLTYAAARNNETVYAAIPQAAEHESLAWLISRYMSPYPRSNWGLLLSLPADARPMYAEAVYASAADGGSISRLMIGCDISEDIPDTEVGAGFSYLFASSDGEVIDAVHPEWEQYEAYDRWSGETKDVTLWDFKSSYDSGGFTVLDGLAAISTAGSTALEEYTGVPACRALITELGGTSRVMIGEPAFPMCVTGHPLVKFLIACETAEPFTLDIVFVSGADRTVFTYSGSGSGIYTPICDLTEIKTAERIERIAIILRSETPVKLEIASVTALGDGSGLGEETLYVTAPTAEDMDGDVKPIGLRDDMLAVYVGIGLFAVVTVAVFALLSRKKPQSK